jgi:antitoxin component of RelBE/YafQ-DinJ toxin-antitoxin module
MITSTVRMDATLKQEAQERLKALGMNFNTFVVIATHQLVAQNRILFDLDVPNKLSPQPKHGQGITNVTMDTTESTIR